MYPVFFFFQAEKRTSFYGLQVTGYTVRGVVLCICFFPGLLRRFATNDKIRLSAYSLDESRHRQLCSRSHPHCLRHPRPRKDSGKTKCKQTFYCKGTSGDRIPAAPASVEDACAQGEMRLPWASSRVHFKLSHHAFWSSRKIRKGRFARLGTRGYHSSCPFHLPANAATI